MAALHRVLDRIGKSKQKGGAGRVRGQCSSAHPRGLPHARAAGNSFKLRRLHAGLEFFSPMAPSIAIEIAPAAPAPVGARMTSYLFANAFPVSGW